MRLIFFVVFSFIFLLSLWLFSLAIEINYSDFKEIKKRICNQKLIKKYPWLQIKNVWTGRSMNSEFTWLDDLPEGWRKAFGLQMVKELDQILRKANYQNKYQITQIKEKWRRVKMV